MLQTREQGQSPERVFLRQCAEHLAGRPVEGRRLVRWYGQWMARHRAEPQELSAQAMLAVAFDPWERPEGLEVRRG